MRFGIVILMLASVAILYYLVSISDVSLGQSMSQHIPMESIQ